MADLNETVIPCPLSRQYQFPAHQAWKLLGVFYIYRVIIASLFSGLFFFAVGPSLLGKSQHDLYSLTSVGYLLITFVFGICLVLRKPSFAIQAQLQILTDLLVLTLLMHASGGIESGIGILLAVSVAAGGLLVGGSCSLVFAAVASLLVLSEQIYSDYIGAFEHTAYTYAGMLGASFFTISLLAHTLAVRAEENAAIAARRGVDIANLKQLNEYVIQHLQSAIVVLDKEHNIRMMNDASLRLFNLDSSPKDLAVVSDELFGRYCEWLSTPNRSLVKLMVDGASNINVRFTRLGDSGQTFNMIFLEDLAISNQRVQQSKLASLGRLTASIAHEIRNPLGAISHASQLLAECPTLSEADHRLTTIIRNHTIRVNEIIENILQLSRRTPSQLEDIELDSWLQRFLQEFAAEHQLSAVPFQLDLQQEDAHARIDASHLKQILDNLCANAMKYGASEHGNIIIRTRREHHNLCIEVVDHGSGICKENIQKIFEPFYTTSTSGTGLGLYISRELAELNQAHLEYEPIPDGGSCFRLLVSDAKRTVIGI